MGLGGDKNGKGLLDFRTGGSEGLGWGNGSGRLCQVGSVVLNNLTWKRGDLLDQPASVVMSCQ